MNASDYSLLSRVFSRSIISDFSKGHANGIFQRAVEEFIAPLHEMTYLNILDELYKLLGRGYRNEYYYKNTLLNKLLIGVHSTNTTTAITELPVAKAKADFVLINGKAVVYEIKTELDNYDRLDDQIANYFKAFDHVAIVTCEPNCYTLAEKYSSTPVGIYTLTSRSTLKLVKNPVPYKDNINHSDIYAILRRSEYEKIITYSGYKLPEVSQFEYYDACYEVFCKLNIDDVYKMFLLELKARKKIPPKFLVGIPKSLRSIVYFSEFSTLELAQILSYINRPYIRRNHHVLAAAEGEEGRAVSNTRAT